MAALALLGKVEPQLLVEKPAVDAEVHYRPDQPLVAGYKGNLGGCDQCCFSPLVIHGVGMEHYELCHPGVGHEDWQEAHPEVVSQPLALPDTTSIPSCSHSFNFCSIFSLNAFHVSNIACLSQNRTAMLLADMLLSSVFFLAMAAIQLKNTAVLLTSTAQSLVM